uniref:Uncharacterized protein n=1 Tax=Anguilla anguilla TaxID=7936 RepID=A0A0E9SQ58_ANGAN
MATTMLMQAYTHCITNIINMEKNA